MSARQRYVAGGLQGAGTLAILAFTGRLVLGALGIAGADASPGLYELAILLAGIALVLRGAALRDEGAWASVAAWWDAPADVRRATVVRLGTLGLEFALLYLLIRVYEIENPSFWTLIAPLLIGGAALHALVPRPHRLGYFLLLSFTAIWLVFGYPDAPWLITLGVTIVAACHLPIPFGLRVAVVGGLGVALAAARVDLLPVPWSRAVWPILGSMFMFRTIVYLYDLRNLKVPASWTARLAYFFLLPNVAFPLFPVVDFAAFRRTYYDTEAHRILQRGVEWMFRGTLQLILYRLVYQYLMIAQGDVRSWSDLARFLVANFLLYVRVSGQFHLIIGSLHLFGFHLPETHRRPFFASSFTDFWRRINIYWKDFMTKVFYYPLHFRLKRYGERTAMVVATLAVFVMTWALHSYQWFWLLGSFPVTATDTLFWGTLAVLLVFNSLREARLGRARTLTAKGFDAKAFAARSFATVGTFIAICLLWSLWMSPTFGDWLALWSVSGWAPSTTMGGLPVLSLGVLLTAAVLLPLSGSSGGLRGAKDPTVFTRGATATTLLMGGVLLLALPKVGAVMGDPTARVVASLRSSQLNARDVTQLQRGYYEDLMGVSRFNSQLWEVYMRRPPAAAWPRLEETTAAHLTGDFRKVELVPGAKINFLGSILTVNRWGMRDRDYEQVRPEGTRRYALMGASVEMGWGVGDGEAFESLLETSLDREARRAPGGGGVEVLNFSIGAFTVPQQLLILDRVLDFSPDVVLLAAHEIDARESVNRILDRAREGVAVPLDSLASAARTAGLGSAPEPLVRKRLEEHKRELLEWMYARFAAQVRARGALPVWVFVPTPDREPSQEVPSLAALARRAGFAVIDLSDAYRGVDLASLQLTRFDYHPNTKGHRLIADALERALRADPAIMSHRAPPAPGH
ncbi:MAG: hypothetical protein K8S21_11475 [Gemmatimonadetes bacterium]|nr:hypothetical protein [Gemmatimonadota bacterium]